MNEPFPVPTPPLALARHLPQDRIHSVRVLESIKCIFNRTTLKNTHSPDTHHSIQLVADFFFFAQFVSFPNILTLETVERVGF